ncbi:hypothetical protein B0H11DRAFT_2109245 [Mycena galericulata]|nr:hypothetical protein B0H11DRAFT_2109245 [Mycena galericulata]
MTAKPSARVPSLPLEMEREIFETAALVHPGEIPTLLRVAHRVLVWIEPFLYKVIPASTHSLTAIKSKPPRFLHNAVRHLLLDFTATWSSEEGRDILKLCTGVVNFAVVAHLSKPVLLPILADMHVWRLSVCLEDLFGLILSICTTNYLCSLLISISSTQSRTGRLVYVPISHRCPPSPTWL